MEETPQAVSPDNDASSYRTSTADQKRIAELYPTAKPSPSGLISVITQEGTGTKTPKYGALVTLHYELRLLDGKKVIESSRARNEPLTIPIGVGRVIKAWDEAVMEMKVGEHRTIIVPHYLAYGVTGSPPTIPPYATLVFDMELLSIK